MDVLLYFENYIARYSKKDKRNVIGVTNAFKEFMKLQGIKSLTMKGLTEVMVMDFAEYLQDKCNGEGAASYFARFKKMLKQAMREKILLVNPVTEVAIKLDESITKHILTLDEIQILTLDEIQKLAATGTANEELKQAFLFPALPGLGGRCNGHAMEAS